MQVFFIFFLFLIICIYLHYNISKMKKYLKIYFASFAPFGLVAFALNYPDLGFIMFSIGFISSLHLIHDRV